MPFIHPIVIGLIPDVLSVGLKDPEIPYHGDTFTATIVGCRLSVPCQGQPLFCYIRKNGVIIGGLILDPGEKSYSSTISISVSDGDWFEADLVQVGVPPNEGSDFVWIVSGAV